MQDGQRTQRVDKATVLLGKSIFGVVAISYWLKSHPLTIQTFRIAHRHKCKLCSFNLLRQLWSSASQGLWVSVCAAGDRHPPSHCSIDLFVHSLPPLPPPPSSFPYFLHPIFLLSVSLSSSALLPYITEKSPQHTDEESGLWADRPGRKQGFAALLTAAQNCLYHKCLANFP